MGDPVIAEKTTVVIGRRLRAVEQDDVTSSQFGAGNRGTSARGSQDLAGAFDPAVTVGTAAGRRQLGTDANWYNQRESPSLGLMNRRDKPRTLPGWRRDIFEGNRRGDDG